MDRSTFRQHTRTSFRLVGAVLTLTSLFFVFRLIWRYSAGITSDLLQPSTIGAIVVCAVFYSLLLLVIGFAWISLILSVDRGALDVRVLIAIYAKTQIYKYIPSNVLHFVGRYALARKHSVTHSALAFSQVAEIILICLTASFLSVTLAKTTLVQELTNRGVEIYPYITISLASVAVVGLASLAIALFRWKSRLPLKIIMAASSVAIVLYAVFFVSNGLLIYCIARLLSAPIEPSTVVGISTAAWLIGFVLPGAPGGMGVRDFVLISGLSASGLDPETSITLALSHRIITMVGDCVLACYGYLLR